MVKMSLNGIEQEMHSLAEAYDLMNISDQLFYKKWPVLSKLLVNELEERHQGSNCLPRLHVSLHQLLVELRSPTDTVLKLLLLVKSVSAEKY
ncbi:hypothetical protein C5167_030743 [Papaver somniferum]|nr:hypothetical protein C5167_030743 [Papaver somniferum]